MRFFLIFLSLIYFCITTFAADSRPGKYPEHWWEPVPKEGAPSWEILPQEAGPGEVILSKRNELGLLSNFADTPFEFQHKRYPSLEGFWQMMKYPEGPKDPRAKFPGIEWRYSREQVAQMIGFEAKDAGSLGSLNMEKMGINWVSFDGRRMTYRTTEKGAHYDLIVKASWEKIRQNPDVRRILLSTGDLILRPDHKQGADTPPAWKYHEIYMAIRRELQEKALP
ncbi:MAG: NADAR family protein [Bdellovibrionaceae bacterium]|nr:NADAR family protein [Bdellovibrionales bacterium]MCB9253988.1 NADAR family protein [Pseudobdellovibrionaceae bacterium]